MVDIKDLGGLLRHHLQNLYSTEQQMLKVLPMLIEQANHQSLKNVLSHHLSITNEQKKRLEQVVLLLNEKAAKSGKKKAKPAVFNKTYKCKGMAGLVEEIKEIFGLRLGKDVIDAVIITCVQKMEHYEICTYGTALAYAIELHIPEVEALLEETLNEEYDTDELLTSLAISVMNKEAEPENAVKREHSVSEVAVPGNKVAKKKKAKAAKNKTHTAERDNKSPGGRAGTSHRRYASGESRGH